MKSLRLWILVLAGIFTISNVIRLTVYAREDELDIMRLVGATRAYVKGPFVVEGMIQALGADTQARDGPTQQLFQLIPCRFLIFQLLQGL